MSTQRDKFRKVAKQKIESFKSDTQDKVVDDFLDTLKRSKGIDDFERMRNARIISIDKIKPDPKQPRKTFDQETLEELSNSIKEHGILQPITVEYIEKGEYYKIISGERRYQAAKLVGLAVMPCIVFDGVNKKDRYAKQLIENIQREDFTPIDKARALLEYKEMLGSEGVWADVEKRVGISEIRRKHFIALLNLPENIQKEIVAIGSKPSKNMITEKHARALLLLNSKEYRDKQIELFELIKNSQVAITGDEALKRAREIKGVSSIHTFKVTYKTITELLEILKNKVNELEAELK